MHGWLRRLKGVLGIGAIWGAAGTLLGGLLGVLAVVAGGWPLGVALIELSLSVGALGFGLGTAFAGTLAIAERRRTFDELSPGRAAVWGTIAGAGLPLLWLLFFFLPEAVTYAPLRSLFPAIAAGVVSYGVLSGSLAAATVAIAKRAPDELSAGRPDVSALPSAELH